MTDPFTLSSPQIILFWNKKELFSLFKIEMPFRHQVCDILCIRPSGYHNALASWPWYSLEAILEYIQMHKMYFIEI